MHPVSCTNTYHDVADLLNYGMVENTKSWISQEPNITPLWNKTFSSGATFSEVFFL